ncbi:hypothetical protein [Natrialba asiatica]|uniref:Uncharacterized protein n=1 Tax=Natrialba asiatica (strain ATCC 700177 / DSM 12278 / JCM 9576 / FERM P-10747 / NBRC 102637 / 172P1) TaxID=29540 RepID=M0ALP9_NATA1|nr:hypothetical protein [Natrialba asiatica]ELY99271.1 hypothetical protein C481_15510 [Natrialba asiatica DSM 12278]
MLRRHDRLPGALDAFVGILDGDPFAQPRESAPNRGCSSTVHGDDQTCTPRSGSIPTDSLVVLDASRPLSPVGHSV